MKKNRIGILLIVTFFSLSLAALALSAAHAARLEASPAFAEVQIPAPPVSQPQAAPQSSYVYTSSNAAPMAIPDCSLLFPLEDIITVPDNFTIQDLNIGLAVSHPDRYDLSISLVSPDLQVVSLLDTAISPFIQNINVMYDEESEIAPGATPHPLPPPYYPYMWDPVDDLAATFYGHPAAGPWKIQICDNGFNAGSGDLLKWSLWFEAIPVNQPSFDLSYFVAPAKVEWGEPIPIHIFVKNNGTQPSATADMVNTFPADMIFDEGSLTCPSGTCYYSMALHAVHWSGSLGVNETAEISYLLTPMVPGTGPYINTATISDGVAPDVTIHTIAYDAPAIIEQFPFEVPTPEFYTNTWPNDWYWGNGMGDKPFHTGPIHWMTAPGGMNNYTSGQISTLHHIIDLTMYAPGSPIALQWWEWHNLDADLGDYGRLTINGTPVHTVSGSNLTWTHRQVDLSTYAGQAAHLEWTLVSQPDGDTGQGWHIDEVSVHTAAPGADLAVIMSDSPDPVLSDTYVTYTINVINNGLLTATNVVITDPWPANTGFNASTPPGACADTGTHVICSLPDLNPLESAQVQLKFWVNQLYEGWLTNTVQVAADQFDPLPLNNTATELTYASISMLIADLGITLQDTYDPIVVGTYQTYTVNVSNQGFVTATSVVAIANLATGMSFSHSVPAICIQVGPDINCNFGMIPAGGNAHVDFFALVEATTPPGILTATAEVTTTVTDPIPLNNTTNETTLAMAAPTAADLTLNMTCSPAALPAGGLLTYTLSVHNAGPLTATGIVITNLLPVDVTYLHAWPAANACALVANRRVVCDMGTAAPGGMSEVYLLVQVKPNALPGLFNNIAQVSGSQPDPNPLNNTDDVWTTVTVGDEIRPLIYTVTPKYGINTGPTTILLTGINFSDSTVIYLGSHELTQTLLINSGLIQAIVPPGLEPGTYDLRTLNTDLQTGRLANAFTVLEDTLIVISDVQPRYGLVDVPVLLNIYGNNFSPDLVGWLSDGVSTSVTLENIEFVNIHQIRAMAPISLPVGVYSLTLENPLTLQGAILFNAYTALDPATYDDLAAFDFGLWVGPPAPVISTTAASGLVVFRIGGTQVLTDVKVAFTLDGVLLGNDTIEMPAVRGRQVATLTWPTPITPGVYTLQATIDPDNEIPEADESNNIITRTIRVLPPLQGTPPTIQSFTINGGVFDTGTRQVTLDVTATGDPAWLYYVEFVFDQNTNTWSAVAQSGWLPYAEASTAYTWVLEPLPGAHYIQVWAATAQGSITSTDPLVTRRLINLLPDPARIAQGQGHVYRTPIAAGQTMVVRLISLEGDADLYVWAPNGTEIARRETSDSVETILFTTGGLGIFQIEVEGYTNARYRLEVYNVTEILPLMEQPPAQTEWDRQPDRRGRDEPLSVVPPSDQLGLPRTPTLLYTVLMPTVQR